MTTAPRLTNVEVSATRSACLDRRVGNCTSEVILLTWAIVQRSKCVAPSLRDRASACYFMSSTKPSRLTPPHCSLHSGQERGDKWLGLATNATCRRWIFFHRHKPPWLCIDEWVGRRFQLGLAACGRPARADDPNCATVSSCHVAPDSPLFSYRSHLRFASI